MRKPGYYWVKYQAEWIIAEWQYEKWWIHATEQDFMECSFDAIDETPITRHELPTEEGIIKYANDKYDTEPITMFVLGALWMKSKIETK